MKNVTLTSFLFLLLNLSVPKKEMNRNIEFKIIDKIITDNSCINLLIVNKTTSNYYLPIINSNESQKWAFILSADENRFFFINKVGYNSRNQQIDWFSQNCIELDEELMKVDELWKKKKQKINTKDLILLKSGKSIKIKVPFNLYIKISRYCTWELKNYRNEKGQKIAINYSKKENELATKFLSLQTLDSLKQMGYELYTKEINSNKVPLILN
jgi:hypothetical protein